MATMSPLRQRMIEDMTIRNLSQATQQSYIYAVRKFSRHFGKSPDRLGVEDVRAYQLHLIAKKRSWSHINQTACALRFFYGVTMGRQEAFERDRQWSRAGKAPARSDAGGDRALLGSGCGVTEPGRADDGLCGGASHRRGLPSEGGLDRQQAHADPRRRRQGREGSLCDAVAATARYSARLLAASASRPVAVSRSGARRSCQHRRLAGRLSGRAAQSEARQARHGPLPAP